ncbi:MAG: hypothetical protein ACPGLV_02735, partial [Bacteroidia bacterium]
MRYFTIFVLLLFQLYGHSQSVIVNVQYQGLKRTKATTLNRVIGINHKRIKTLDSSSVIAKAKQDLYNTRLFSSITYKSQLKNDTLKLTFTLIERWYTYAVPYFDLIDRNFNEWWVTRNHDVNRIIIGADFTQKNVTGRNDDLSLSILAGNQNRLQLEYRLLNFIKQGKFGLKFTSQYHAYRNVNVQNNSNQLVFSHFDDVSLTKFQSNTSFYYHPSFAKHAWLNLGYQYSLATNNVLKLNPNYLGIENLSQLNIGILKTGFRIDTRDIRGYAQKGSLLFAELTRFTMFKRQSLSFTELNIRYTRHVPFKEKADLGLTSIIKLSTDKPRPYELNRGLGWGVNAIRCYDYYVIDGAFFFAQKTSIRYKIIDKNVKAKRFPIKSFRLIPLKVAPKLFFDVAYVK